MLLSLRVPEIQLKNSKGLSNEKLNELKSRLAELAKQRRGEVRAFHFFEKYSLDLNSSKSVWYNIVVYIHIGSVSCIAFKEEGTVFPRNVSN